MLAACALGALVLSANPAAAGPSLVVDLDGGRVLSQEDAMQRWYPASLTKLLTAYVAFRAVAAGEVTLKSPVRISKNAAKEPPSKMGYPAGSVLALDNALKIIMVKSANDVATAIGESIAGSESAFAARMNAESIRLGMTGSRWMNAHGLHHDGQYTTAHDLAVLATAIRRDFPQYADYFRMEGLADGQTKMINHNDLIGRFEGADGMKTGYTCPSGFNLIASATRQGRTLLAVVIGERSSEERAVKAADLLAAGFGRSAAGAPTLASMTPPARAGIDQAPNMRSRICTPAAYKARLDAGEIDKNGKVIVSSPHLADKPSRERVLVAVGLGGATGPRSPHAAADVEYARVPIPTPRPDYRPVEASAVR
ncbi:D-alanyl-D-alanine carboxypeptidase [Aquibium carbonis]|uniref:D-alanyl-D-alanine carboxypeptidase n=2 Tax=Aquibium carbonis TaxID=2495581 RepID=A0A429YZE8_9HYPH|nr:D-alanyl-D-alanine carboxypeptidase [Aquibium carbonis]